MLKVNETPHWENPTQNDHEPIATATQTLATLAVSPNHQLYVPASAVPHHKTLAKTLATSQIEGLLYLAAEKKPAEDASLLFWRQFVIDYFHRLCHTHADNATMLDPKPMLTDEESSALLWHVPPMIGAEYVSDHTFKDLYQALNLWIEQALLETETVGQFIARYLPHWSSIGRVCFHLAENKNDTECPFAFMATYAASLNSQHRVQYQPLSKALEAFAGQKNRRALLKLLAPIHEASEHCDWVKDLLESHDIYYPLAWTPEEAYQFLQSVSLLEESGLLVRLPDWWRKKPRPRVQVTVGHQVKSRVGADELLDFQWSLVLGDETLTEAEKQALLAQGSGLVSLRGQWVEVDSEKLQAAISHWQLVQEAAKEGITFTEGMRLLAGANKDLSVSSVDEKDATSWSFVNAGAWLSDLLKTLRSPDTLTFEAPQHLQATLRPYQQTGVNWLNFLTELGLGACLADDMGLGKTIQILALLLLKQQKALKKPCLLVLPASLLGNWKAELVKFAPCLSTLWVHSSESSREKLEAWSTSSKTVLQPYNLVITTYATLVRQSWLQAIDWHLVILDEAQAIKNPTAEQTKTVKKLKSDARIALTGTPVENRLGDLWSLFDFLSPGLLSTVSRFKDFIKSLEKQDHIDYAPLRKLIQPYILRRLKTDKSIIADLPDKTEMTAWCSLSALQAKLYAKAVHDLKQALEKEKDFSDHARIKRRGLVLSFLTRFKQICNHPSQSLADGEYAEKHSGKFARLKEICEEIASRQEKVLVFTQYREMTEPLSTFLTTIFNRPGLVLHGGTPVAQRKRRVDAFQDASGPPFFVLSLKAGGTGLNLTAASHVIHFDRWWNPAVENQATDRAYRIGQQRNVLVHKFVCRGTVEEKIDQLIHAKTSMATELLSSSAETLLTEMDDQALINLVSLDLEQSTF